MNRRLLLLALVTHAFCRAQVPPSRLSPRAALDLANAAADQRIQIYEATLKTKPDNLPAEIGLTSACLQKLRESGDGAYLDRAAKLVDTMLRQDGGSLISLRLQNEVDLQRHEFKAVADRSRDLIRFSPSDPGVWANLGDASMELGAYDDAGKAYLKMFALRPNLASYNRLAYFRFVTGDVPNAIFLMKSAVESGDSQPENIAWCLAELGDMYFKTGSIEEAQRAFRSAIDIFPTLHRALAGLGRIAASEKQFDVAIAYYKRAQSIVPLVEYAFVLEDLYTAAGQPGRAREQQSLVDVIEQLGAVKNERTNRNLALGLAEHDRNLPEALRLIEAELPSRGDVYTWDAYSWILFKCGRIPEARSASSKALKLQTPEPLFYYHAGKIALTIGDTEAAHGYMTRLMSLNPRFNVQ